MSAGPAQLERWAGAVRSGGALVEQEDVGASLHPHHVNVTSVETCPVCMRRLIEHMRRIDRKFGVEAHG